MATFDEAVPSLGELLAGQQQAPQYAQPQQQDGGVLGGARNWLQSNPEMGMMLLGTMMAAARGHNMGNAVAEGAKFSLNAQIGKGQYEQQEKDKALKQANEDKRMALEERKTAAQEQTSASQNKYYGAQTEEVLRSSEEKKRNEGLGRQKLETQLKQYDEAIATSKDARKTAELQRRRLAVQTQLEETYGSMEREAAITGQQLDNEGKVSRNLKSEADVARAAIDMADWTKMTAEERTHALYAKGAGKTPATASERLQNFVQRAGANYTDVNGKMNMKQLMKDWEDIEAYGTPKADATAQDRQAKFNAAKAATRVGGIFTFEGKTYRRDQ